MGSNDKNSVRSDLFVLGCAGIAMLGLLLVAALLLRGLFGKPASPEESREAQDLPETTVEISIPVEDSFGDTTATGGPRENAVGREWLSFGVYGGSLHDAAFLRFPISLDPDAEVLSATIEFRASEERPDWGTGRSTVRIYLLDDANQGPFATGSYPNHDALIRIPVAGTYVAWEVGPWETGTTYRTSNIAPLIRRFLERDDYAPGKQIGLKIRPGPRVESDGYGRLYAATASDGGRAPVLVLRLRRGSP
jgi:hypothetical protein